MSDRLTSRLTEEQRLAAMTLDRPVSVVAAAGSGKTTVLVERYVRLLATGKKPAEILTVTFTTDAADQLKSRILARLKHDEQASEDLVTLVEQTPQIGTIHSFCYRVLDQFGSHIGLLGIEKILTPFDFARVFDEHYRAWLEEMTPETLGSLLDSYTHQELRTLARELYRERALFTAATRLPGSGEEPLHRLVSALESHFHTRGWYSFDDLESLSLRIFLEAPATAERLQKEIRALLIDEFQDTSRAQWEILRRLIGKEPEKLFVVGDPKQSIYRFRNADVRLFYEVSAKVQQRNGLSTELTVNFRSQRKVLEAINRIAARLFDDVPFTPMQAASDTEGRARIFRYPVEGLRHRSEMAKAERAAIIPEIHRLCESGVSPKDIALLFRVSDRMQDYANDLQSRGIAASCRRTNRLLGCYDTLDLLNFLRMLMNPLDDYFLSAFLRSPYVGMSYEELWCLAGGGEARGTKDKKNPLFEKLLQKKDPRTDWIVSLVESGEFSVAGALGRLFAERVPFFPKNSEPVLRVLGPLLETRHVGEAVTALEAWEKDDISLTEQQTSDTGVKLMTVHAAKGLEFPHVILVDLLRPPPRPLPLLLSKPGVGLGARYRKADEWAQDETYEKLQREAEAEDREESKRVLYVAMTRAIESLTISLPEGAKSLPKDSWAEWLDKNQGPGA